MVEMSRYFRQSSLFVSCYINLFCKSLGSMRYRVERKSGFVRRRRNLIRKYAAQRFDL